jgi:hypothetical protein
MLEPGWTDAGGSSMAVGAARSDDSLAGVKDVGSGKRVGRPA